MSLEIQIMLAHHSLASNAFFAIVGVALKEQVTLILFVFGRSIEVFVEFFPTLLHFHPCPC